MIKSFYTLPVFLSSKNCNKNLLINDRSQVHSPRYKLSTLHISSSDGVGRGPGLKTDYKLRLWSERESESEVEAGSWGWRVLSSRMWRWLRMRDGGGRVEARPGLRVSVAPHFTCRPLGFRYIYIYNMYTMCGGEGGERDKLNMGEVGLNGFIFTSNLVWGEKNEILWQLFCKLFSLQPSLPFA